MKTGTYSHLFQDSYHRYEIVRRRTICDTIRGWDNMSISKIRSLLYKSSRILGDVQAAKNGTIGKRVVRRAAGRATNKLLKSIFK